MHTIPYRFADACGIASSSNTPSKFPGKSAYGSGSEPHVLHAGVRNCVETPTYIIREPKKHIAYSNVLYNMTPTGLEPVLPP